MDATTEFATYRKALADDPIPPGISPHEDTPIVLYAVVERCVGFRNRRLREWYVKSAPFFVFAHILKAARFSGGAVVALAEAGHNFSVEVVYHDVPAVQW